MTTTDTAAPITATQVADVLAQGYGLVDGILDPGEREALGAIYDDAFSRDDIARKPLGGTDAHGRETLPQVLTPNRLFPQLDGMRIRQRALAVAQAIFGPEAEFRNDHMILKPAGYGAATPWHQDQAYHAPHLRYRKLNVWTPLDGATIAGGCMHFVPESHLGVILPHHRIETPDGQALAAVGADYWDANGVAVECPVGSATLHHSGCLHYAGANTTDRDRRAYIQVFTVPSAQVARDRPLVFTW